MGTPLYSVKKRLPYVTMKLMCVSTHLFLFEQRLNLLTDCREAL
jgi:hypothetical protein